MTPPRTPAEALAFLARARPSGIRLGLERVQAALRGARPPRARLPRAARRGHQRQGLHLRLRRRRACTPQGYRVGLYTSPHLVRVNERIRVDGEEISDELLGAAHPRGAGALPEAAASRPAHLLRVRHRGGPLALRAGAAWTSRCWRRAWAAGWTPPTPRARRSPRSPRSRFDHMEYLGHTLAAIAAEKAGILKPGVPGGGQPAGARGAGGASSAAARERGRAAARWRGATSRSSRERGRRTLRLPRAADLRRSRASRWACAGAPACRTRRWRSPAWSCSQARACRVSPESAARGARRGALARPAGGARRRSRRCVLDGAHNPAGVEVLLAALRRALPGPPRPPGLRRAGGQGPRGR